MEGSSRGRVRVEAAPRRVRVLFGGEYVADTRRALYVWERPYYPTYYLPLDDVRAELLTATGETHRSPSRGEAALHTVTAGGREAVGAAAVFETAKIPELAGHVRFDFDAMDAWFEEDEEIFVHPKDPYKRVDILASSRHVRVEVDGVTVAESTRPHLLFETGLPTRHYLPKTDVRMDLLTPTDTHTRCPYKGTASYYAVRAGDTTHPDLAWWYPHPTLESAKIAGLVAFYDEKVDVYLDGELQDRPRTPFS